MLLELLNNRVALFTSVSTVRRYFYQNTFEIKLTRWFFQKSTVIIIVFPTHSYLNVTDLNYCTPDIEQNL